MQTIEQLFQNCKKAGCTDEEAETISMYVYLDMMDTSGPYTPLRDYERELKRRINEERH